MPSTHVNLHAHTTFSPGDGFRMPEEHVRVVAELGQPALAVTEHGNVSSHVKHEKACRAAGIRPVFGVEAYCESDDPRGQYKHHLTILASDQTGYQNLLRVVSKSWENYRYKPTVTGEMLAEHHDGLIVLSGCLGGRLATALLGGKGEEDHAADLRAASRVAAQFREVFGDRYYLEIQPHPTLTRQHAMNQALERIGRRMGIPRVATFDTHYPTQADQHMYPVLHAIDRGGSRNTVEAQAQSWEYDILLAHHSTPQAHENLTLTGLSGAAASAALATTLEIADRCNVELPKLRELEYPGRLPSEELIWKWLRAGWRYRGFGSLPRAVRREYSKRVKYEMNLIEMKGFVNYFLVISDMVRWAKNNGIPVGPARGSAAASLVCYLLRITEVDPMRFPNLLFERFIDINRHDLPDIDLDFDDEQRWRVRDYLVRRYGADHVGNIGTFTMYKGKNSLDDVAKVFSIPAWEVERVKEGLLERSSGDLRAANSIEDSRALFPKVDAVFQAYPDLEKAQLLEGNLKGFSVHAAGLVVSNQPLTDSVAVYQRYTPKGELMGEVLSIDKYDAEYINALKIDALGLTTMGMIRICLELVGMTLEQLYAIPLDDEKVYEGFRNNEVIGVFQFDGRAMRSVNREVKPDNFAEVCDINALARPGPLHSGAAAEYIMVKHGKKKAQRLHPIVGDITAHTNQQIVYQEQILQVVRLLGGFSWEEAAHVRKLISKKQGEQAFSRLMGKFIDGCAERGVDELVAQKIWKQLVTAGAYAFNAAHCVSYGLLAYWTMWLKQNHPLEFYCAALQKYKEKDKLLDIMREATAKGVTILPPHPERSDRTWTIEDGALRAGLTQVRGIGDKVAETMLEYRPLWRRTVSRRVDMTWQDYTAVRGIGPVTMRKVEEFCAEEDPFGIHYIRNTLRQVRRWIRDHGEENGIPYPRHRSDDIPYEPKRGEYVWVGFVRVRNLKDIYELHRSRTGEELDPETVREPQYVNYVVLTCEDETGPLVVTVHRWRGFYEKHKDKIWDMDPNRDVLVVRGYKRNEYRRAVYAEELHVLRVR